MIHIRQMSVNPIFLQKVGDGSWLPRNFLGHLTKVRISALLSVIEINVNESAVGCGLMHLTITLMLCHFCTFLSYMVIFHKGYNKGYKSFIWQQKTPGTLIFLGSYWRRSRDLKKAVAFLNSFTHVYKVLFFNAYRFSL